jgi:protein tyrosine phosphatase (PTP) superfamily phosphohydrolase (DUF442 family)
MINLSPDLQQILTVVPVQPNLVTSGQPTREQLALIAAAGVEVVINLALTDASNALHGEDRNVLSLGIDYVNLPLLFDQPSARQIQRVMHLLHEWREHKVWLHCALNYRVSSVIYVYRVLYLGMDQAEARALLEQIWTPDAVWQRVIDELLHTVAPYPH